ncbi:hypothetical protein HID58_062450 [Brassica napus]|uniref:Uncharacterized protein n=5 Tax=Brassica TaxID=3705 RepID=A0ABQ8A1H1_BRANA|nr:hypothetical protein HID58_062450 [Brassica napus]
MTTKTCLVFFLSSLLITNIALAQDRAPHGLAYETPVAFSPSEFDFFHAQPENPDATLDPCAESGCSPLPVAAKVQGGSAKEQQSEIATMSIGSRTGMGAGGAVMIILGLFFPLAISGNLMEKKKSDESRPPLMALNHVSRLCMDVKKSLEFLTSGFVETERAASLDLEGAWLFSYGVGIHLVQVKDEDKNGPSWTITSRSSAKTWKLWKRCSRK